VAGKKKPGKKGISTLKRAVAIALVLLLSSTAYGAIFGWTDSEGTAHYTNRESEIPPPYRDKAKLIVREPTDGQTPQQAGQTQTSPPSVARSKVPPTGTEQAVANPDQQNAMQVVPGVKKRVGGRYFKPRGPTEEE
jgi:hypothetical protein